MNTSGEAADQVVRMSMEVGEAALKISGKGAKQLAVLLYAILKEQKKTKGRARLETLVRSGRPLTVFSVKESDLKKFVQEAKRYGILYCAVRNPRGSSDGMADIMVKEEDAPRINRIIERFQFASVTEAAQVKTDIEKSREEKGVQKEKISSGKGVRTEKTTPEGDRETQAGTGKGADKSPQDKEKPEKSQEDILVDELLGTPVTKEESKQQNRPFLQRTDSPRLSGNISGKRGKAAEGTSKLYMPAAPEKPSVRGELKEIRAGRKKEKETHQTRNEPARTGGGKKQNPPQHKQPQAKRKSEKQKEKNWR